MSGPARLTSRLLARKGQAKPALSFRSVGADYMDQAFEPSPASDDTVTAMVPSPPLEHTVQDIVDRSASANLAETETKILGGEDALRASVRASLGISGSSLVEDMFETPSRDAETPDAPKVERAPVKSTPVENMPVENVAASDAPTIPLPTRVAAKGGKRAPKKAGKKVAMTLRLDEERHFKLRLLSAHRNRSSQKLLTEALDQFLEQNASHIKRSDCHCLNGFESETDAVKSAS
ncbi:MAG: hypothetical protein AAGF15_08315 [Pseudomonadota bacterium]